MIFIKGPDSVVRIDQIAAAAVHDDGVAVVLLSGDKVLIRKSLDEFMDLLGQAAHTLASSE